MPKFFVEENQINGDKIYIVGQDVNHIKNVLRLRIDDDIQICNKESKENFLCRIQEVCMEKIICNIVEKLESNSESNIKITIFQGLPKSEKMELIIQKIVELGAYEITPTVMKRCVVKLNEKDKQKKVLRWQKISEVASKQSGRDIVPKVNDIDNIKNVCTKIDNYDIVLVAYENEKIHTLKEELTKIKSNLKDKLKIAVVIGPEGGIEEEEIDLLEKNGAKIITLGNRILRTETVALAMTSIIMYELGGI